MVRAVAFCPHPPLLVPAVASGAAPELDDLRAACRAAIAAVAGVSERLVLLGSDVRPAAFGAGARGTFRPYGVDVEVALGRPDAGVLQLPLALAVGAWLVADAAPGLPVTAVAVPATAAIGDPPLRAPVDGDIGLIVMGDGSARRSTVAPGYFDGRAAGFDAAVVRALADADVAALAALDPRLGGELLAAGVPAWRAAGALLAGCAYVGRLRYDAAPYGVGYFVADWSTRD